MAVYPTRLLNAYFAEAGLSYRCRVGQSHWTVGGTVAYAADPYGLVRRLRNRPATLVTGFGAGLEARMAFREPKPGTLLGLALGLDHSRLFTDREYAQIRTSQPDVSALANTPITVRRTELGAGLTRQRRWASGFAFEWIIGIGVGRRGWYTPRGVTLAPDGRRDGFNEAQGFLGDGNEPQTYVAPRVRVGFSYTW